MTSWNYVLTIKQNVIVLVAAQSYSLYLMFAVHFLDRIHSHTHAPVLNQCCSYSSTVYFAPL